MPRPPLLGEVASSVSNDDGEVQPQQPLPVVNLSVTGFAVTAPLVGEPLAGRRVFGVWRFAPFGSAGVMFASAVDDALGAPAIRLKNESHAKASPTRGGGIERQR